MPIFSDSRQRKRGEAIRRLREIAPQIAERLEGLHCLIAAYNDALLDARWLQDEVLDDLEAAEENGVANDAMRFARHLWAETDFMDLADCDVPKLDDADRLERLPVDV